MNIEQLAQTLTSIPAISGNESRIARFLRESLAEYCDKVIFDQLGSIYGVKKSKQKQALRVMIHGHMDEFGLIVNHIQENGMILALALGKVEKQALLGQKILLYTQEETCFEGTIVAQNTKQTVINDRNQVLIDIGMESSEEVSQANIELGDMVVFAQSFFTSQNQKRYFARNWNGRFAPLSILQLLDLIKGKEYPFDLYIGCSVQEHVGLRGVQTATNLVQPDLALILDTAKAEDYLADGDQENGVLGKGFLFTYYDTTVLPNRKVMQALRNVCQKHDIPFQYYYSMSDSDAGWINKLRQGAPVVLLNVAVRNMDTPVQEIAACDVASAVAASEAFLDHLTIEQIQDFKKVNESAGE